MDHPSDEDILAAELSAVLARVDPVPARLRDAASAAFAWRDPDAQLASLVEQERAAVLRGGPHRMLTFEAGDVTVDVEVATDDTGVRLTGQLTPMTVTLVQVRHSGGTWQGRTDELGRFAVRGLSRGPMRIRVRDGAEAVLTAVFLA